jgi:S1-C subfamily serine protease
MTEGRFRRAYIGIAGGQRPLPPRLASRLERGSGIEIVEVIEGSPAAAAGLRAEDLIVGVDDNPVESMQDLQRLTAGDLIGSRVTLSVVRDGQLVPVELVPVELEIP